MTTHHNFGAQFHGQLFDTAPYQSRRDYDPEAWTQTATWHGSNDIQMPEESGLSDFGEGFHHGTLHAAHLASRYREDKGFLHPLQMSGPTAINAGMHQAPRGPLRAVFSDDFANDEEPHPSMPHESAGGMVSRGYNVPYANDLEDAGAVSFRSPRQNLATWAEDVQSDPNAPTRHKALAEHGYDLSIKHSDSGPVTHQPAFDTQEDALWDAEDTPDLRRSLASPQFRKVR